ncbi:TonB-linked outer membrane protein, SusC/RagA family [Mariniphaga anaerophila]|uniref:TonB-linked outer membrane protein, SusC/RagA family n=1 Tax=Mariniphaga anaerophila TaxID=1484053 RepID=A0A1M4ZYY8_9BACT|nr:SusC/RagA family TonB-linked outer membrane protein [Mariniphaga anaerophila]SHF23067.1 TonB-linked outer membrane protein, SusC/RagA family [Mariniphaga anaerophila]
MKNKLSKVLFMMAFLLLSVYVYAQVQVSGTVKDAAGELLPGVSIQVKGTAQGTITDMDGRYSLNVPDAQSVLVFSFVGMQTREMPVDGKSIVDITLSTSTIGVDEIVVTALGMKKEKKALGYNISSVNSENLETGGVSNALKSLEGKITGVQMNSLTSSPTSSVMFNIRGATSLAGIMKGKSGNINNETQPLIVVDGVPVATNTVGTTGGIDVGNYMSSINPNDIESVSVLKGASAAALYGSQAGNGVILITTKSGSGAKKGIGVSVSSSISFDQAYSAPPVQRQFFQGDEDGSPLTEDKKGLGWAIDDNVNNSEPVWRWNILTQEWEQSVLQIRGDDNPLLAFLETGIMYDNNVAITGNYDKGNYRLNLGNLTSNSVVPSNKTIRNNVSFSSEYNLTDKVVITSQASYSHTFVPNQSHVYGKREDNPLAHAMSMPINMPSMDEWKQANNWLFDWDGTYQNTPYLKNPGEDRLSRVNDAGFDKAIGKNGPYFAAEEVIRTYAKDVVFGKVQMDWELANNLSFTIRSGLSHQSFAFERKTPWGAERSEKGGYEQRHSNSLGIKNDAMFAYSNYFKDDKLSVDALVGVSYNYSEGNSSGFDGKELATPNSFSYSSLPASVRQAASFNRGYPSRNYGAYGTVSLGWLNMVYLELTGRNDWVGILDHEKDNHFYPGASLSWIATETFKEMGDWVTLLKLRGGYAETGYGIGNPVNLDSYGISGSTWGGIAMGTVGGSLVDSSIEPELNVTKEIGVDFGFFDNRIFGEFTAYSKNHINQIQNLPVVGSSGFNSVLTNMGSVKSDGIEASLTVVPVRNKDWTWSVTGNVTSFKSVIDELDDRFAEKFYDYEGSSKLSLFKGSRVGDLYASDPIARIQSGKYKGMMLMGIEGIIEESIGTTEYIKANGYLGNMNPDAIIGINTDLRYKNWSLGIVSSLRLGGVFISETQKIMIDDGMADIGAIYKDKYHEYWTGGRFAGGLESMPSPGAIFPGAGWEEYRDAYSGYMEYYNGDPRYFGYWNAVFIDPNRDLSGMSPEEKLNLPDDYYILNGEDPLYTMYAHPYYMEGQELWSGAQFRTWDATNFKVKEVNISYRFQKAAVERLHCQDITITAFAKNVMFWAKNRMNEDPETAFRDGISGMGVSQFGLPPIRTMGLRVAVNF